MMPSARSAPGLALVEAVGRARRPAAPLQVRVGIATGLVVVGDLIGAGAAQEQAVVGETPNLAARLQALAEPGTVVIAASTRRLLGRSVRVSRSRAASNSRASLSRCRPGRWCGASAVESRFEALRTATTPLVGRDEEIELLMRRWEQAKSGDGSVVLISGEPGIGKSRIAADHRGAARRRATHPPALFLLAAPPGQRALSRASPSSNGRPASGARIRTSNGWTSWRRCWPRRPTISARPSRCSRTCCRSRPATAIRR